MTEIIAELEAAVFVTDLPSSTGRITRYIELIRQEFLRRKEKNPRYSMRAFANYLGIHPSSMCRVMKSQESLSVDLAGKLIERLPFTKSQRKEFILSLAEEKRLQTIKALNEVESTSFLMPIA